MKKFLAFWHEKPRALDAAALSLFAFVITFQPFFLHGEINIFEVGLYLPGINAILNGLVPFHDFFHLRGPFELYAPAFLMKIFGAHLGIMYLYFYAGTILGLILCILIGREIYQTRYILYLMAPVLVARTFPRIVYHFWGGMRYAAGLLALFCAIKFFKKERALWMFLAGMATSVGAFISAEIGFCSAAGIMAALIFSFIFGLQSQKTVFKGFLFYAMGAFSVAIPFVGYLFFNNALTLYLESVYTVVTNLHDVFDPHLVSVYPKTALEGIAAMLNPACENFRHMTPAYLYLVVFLFLGYRIKAKSLSRTDVSIVCLVVYGSIMYVSSFRGIWAAQFEMALQPGKILLFFILGEVYLFLRVQKDQLKNSIALVAQRGRGKLAKSWLLAGIYFLFAAFLMSSLFYPMARYQKRFIAYQILQKFCSGKPISELVPWADKPHRTLTIDRVKGVIVPEDQARELEEVIPLIQRLTKPGEVVFTYPEIGTYNFLADRPFLGRFPIATFSWLDDRWHKELMADLKTVRPKIIIVSRYLPEDWKAIYLGPKENRQKYEDVMTWIQTRYQKVATTEQSEIYQLKTK